MTDTHRPDHDDVAPTAEHVLAPRRDPVTRAAAPATGAGADAVIAFEKVTKVYRTGAIAVAALPRDNPHDQLRGVCGHRRAFGFGQVDADAHLGLPRHAEHRGSSDWPERTSAA